MDHQPPDPARPDTLDGNIEAWTKTNAEHTDPGAERAWDGDTLEWGLFGVADADIGSPLGEVAGLDILDLGCGSGYFSARLAKRGARPVGVDPTPAQLATARRMQERTGITFPLIEAYGESVPLADASFDVVFSEYGASLWADPARWIPEAARLLRPNGRLVFLTNSTLVYLCSPDEGMVGETLLRPQLGMHHITWPDEPGTEFHLPHGEWIRLLRRHGFEILDLIEVHAEADSKTHDYYEYVSADWGRQWPAEDIWVARRST